MKKHDKEDYKEIEHDITMETKMKDLEYAKKAVQTLLDEPNASVDFKGIEYWAGRVERLREFIKNNL